MGWDWLTPISDFFLKKEEDRDNAYSAMITFILQLFYSSYFILT